VVRFADQRQGSEALEEAGGSEGRRDAGGDFDGFFGRAAAVFGVGGVGDPGYAVAGLEVVGVAGAGGYDCAFCFAAEDFGLGGWVEAGAEVAWWGVSKVEKEGGEGRGVTCRCSLCLCSRS